MSPYWQNIRAREAALNAHWEAQHGPYPPRSQHPSTWPEGWKPPCVDCRHYYVFDETGTRSLEGVRRAATFFDAPEARYLVCDPCWLRRMRDAGFKDRRLKRMLVRDGGFSETEAQALLELA